MSISLNNSTVFVLVKSTKLRANSNSNSKLELDDFEPSLGLHLGYLATFGSFGAISDPDFLIR